MFKKYCVVAWILLIGLNAQSVIGQEAVEGTPKESSVSQAETKRIIKLKNGITEKIEELIMLYSDEVLPVPKPDEYQGIDFDFTSTLDWLMVKGAAGDLDVFEALANEVDTGFRIQKNLEVVFYLLSATEAKSGGKYPSQLSKVVKQLEDTFQYEGYSLIETASLRTRVGTGLEHTSAIPLNKLSLDKSELVKAYYKIRLVNIEEYSVNKYSMDIKVDLNLQVGRVRNFNVGENIQSKIEYHDVGMELESSIDINNQQSIVLGKSNIDNSDDALFVVMQIREAL